MQFEKVSAVSAGISIREFARRAGCDEKVVRRKVKTAHLPALSDGSIDPAYLAVDWRSGAGLDEARFVTFSDSADTPALWSKAEAERIKECYAALLRQLSYERESAAVVEIDDVVVAVVAEYSEVRARLCRIGANVSARLKAPSSAAAIKVAIDAEVTAALDGLTI